MRFGGVLTAALFGAVMGASGAMAQSSAPEETPPASFKGRQYVDSAGCVFVRAGYGDATKWVPRINRDRTAVCGFKPSLPAEKVAVAAPAKVVAPKPVIAKAAPAPKMAAPVMRSNTVSRRSVKAPIATIAANMVPEARSPNAPYSPVKTLAPRAMAQPASARGQTRATRVQVAMVQPVVQKIPREVSVGGVAPVVTTSPEPPGGWKPAFEDGRLNPYRGPRTQSGDAQMAQRWNTKTPMGMVAVPQQRVIYVPVASARMSAKTVAPASSATRQPAGSGKRFVQVGSFGVPSNAAAAKARLRALGLPVATGRAGRLTVVYAGPFSAPSALQNALNSARSAGFRDALLR